MRIDFVLTAVPQWLFCFKQGSYSDLRVSIGTPVAVQMGWPYTVALVSQQKRRRLGLCSLMQGGGPWMESSGHALRAQVTGVPQASSEGPSTLGTQRPEGTVRELALPGLQLRGGPFSQPLPFPSNH